MQRAAFFDVDNTMLAGASIYYFARGLAARKYFTVRDVAFFTYQQAKFRLLGQENTHDAGRAKDAALAFVAGRPVDEIVRHGGDIYDELIAHRVWDGARALAERHLNAGEEVWLVTATPVQLAAIIADRLGLTGALGTRAEIVDGRYTGRLIGDLLHGPAKAVAIRELAADRALSLDESTAYSDSFNDLPMLTAVGTPVAVNPDRELRRYARKHGWRVFDFRSGRKAAKVGLPAAAGVGAVAGGVAIAWALRRRGESRDEA